MKTFWFILCVAAAGCTLTPKNGQFACGPEESCPAGFSCADNLCFSNVGPTPPDAGAGDANTPDGNAPDTFDASPLPDAGPMDAGLPPCTADFCSDFDEDEQVDADWSVAEVRMPAAVARVLVDGAPSPPAVFRSSVGEIEASSFRAGRLSFQRSDPDFATVTPRLSLALQFRVDSMSEGAGAAVICNIRYGGGERYVSVTVEPGATSGEVLVKSEIYSGGEPPSVPPSVTPLTEIGAVAMGAWHSLRVTIPDRSPDNEGEPVGGGVSFSLDGAPQDTGTLPPAVLLPMLRVDVGLGSVNPGSVVVDIDNVELDYLADE